MNYDDGNKVNRDARADVRLIIEVEVASAVVGAPSYRRHATLRDEAAAANGNC